MVLAQDEMSAKTVGISSNKDRGRATRGELLPRAQVRGQADQGGLAAAARISRRAKRPAAPSDATNCLSTSAASASHMVSTRGAPDRRSNHNHRTAPRRSRRRRSAHPTRSDDHPSARRPNDHPSAGRWRCSAPRQLPKPQPRQTPTQSVSCSILHSSIRFDHQLQRAARE